MSKKPNQGRALGKMSHLGGCPLAFPIPFGRILPVFLGNLSILIKKNSGKRCATLPLNNLQRGMAFPFPCSLSLMTLSTETLFLHAVVNSY